MRTIAIAALFALCPAGLFAGPQTLMLRDGSTISGTFVSGNATTIVFRDDNGVRRQFPVSRVQSIDFNNQHAYYGPNGSNYPNGNPQSASRMQSGTYRGGHALIPAGEKLTVRTDTQIDSDVASVGQSFPATIANDVVDSNGNVAIPRGSPAELVIRQVSSGGTITGSPNLQLDLQSVSVNGRRYMVSTEDVTRSSNSGLGANKRTAEMVGGGAALGTLLGAIVGGGKGAAIGAAVGAAGGATTQVLTRGKQVKVPAESELTFALDQPARLVER